MTRTWRRRRRRAILGFVSMFSGGNLSQSTIFGLGIMPYISASIIFQLLGQRLSAAGKAAKRRRERPQEDQRIHPLCHGRRSASSRRFMCVQYIMSARSNGGRSAGGLAITTSGSLTGQHAVIIMTAGTVFLMWIGEQIDEYGIGNGISLIIMAGIVARIPDATVHAVLRQTRQLQGIDLHARRRRRRRHRLGEDHRAGHPVRRGGRRRSSPSPRGSGGSRRSRPSTSAAGASIGGTRQFLPLQVNQAGVMPVIFASSLLDPARSSSSDGSADLPTAAWASVLRRSFQRQGYLYNMLYIAMIYFFCYFWTAITFNPKDMANNLKDYGSFIPGYRPGKRTADYLERVMMRITYVGAAFLAVIAIIPSLISSDAGSQLHASPASTAAPAC